MFNNGFAGNALIEPAVNGIDHLLEKAALQPFGVARSPVPVTMIFEFLAVMLTRDRRKQNFACETGFCKQ